MPLSISSVLTHVYEDNCLIASLMEKWQLKLQKGYGRKIECGLNDVCFFVVDFVVLIGFLFNRVCVRNKRIILFRDYSALLIPLLLISLVSCHGNSV